MPDYTYRCPKCGNTDKIDVCADIWVRIVQSGQDGEFETDADIPDNRDHTFDGNHGAICQACGFNGNLDRFEMEQDDKCRRCEGSLDDGEGQDGYCGSCADKLACTQCGDIEEGTEPEDMLTDESGNRFCSSDCRRLYIENCGNFCAEALCCQEPEPGKDYCVQHAHLEEKYECQYCGATWAEENLINPIKDIDQRVAPGEPMPAGECPDCGALCHEKEED